MRITAARAIPVRLPLRAPLATGHGVLAVRDGIVLALDAEDGTRGWGETFPLAAFGMESCARAGAALREVVQTALGRDADERDALLDAAEQRWPDAPGARAAFDFALHDLAGRIADVSAAALLGAGAPRRVVAVSALLVAREPSALARDALAAVEAGFRALKMKLGEAELARDLARIAALRDAVGPWPELRVDANGRFTPAGAPAALARLAAYSVDLVEEPLADGDPGALAALRAAAPLRIAADESLRDAGGAEKLLAAGAVDALILKPAALGGLRAAARIAARARDAGVDAIVTSFLDSALGVAAALQLAAALPEPAPAAGLATGRLLALDLAPPLTPAAGRLALPATPGLGVTPAAERIAACRSGPGWELRA